MLVRGKQISDIIIDDLNSDGKISGMTLAVISVGDNKSAMSYLKGIMSKATLLNVEIEHKNLEKSSTTDDYIKIIQFYNQSEVDGILLLTPLPSHIDFEVASQYLDYKKDVDCLTKTNSGSFYLSTKPTVGPCTAKAVMEVFKANNYDLTSKKVCIVGASNIVGKPVAKLMLDENATVTLCNYHTSNLEKHTSESDIVIVAVGVAKLIKKEHLKKDAIVVDVGINFVDGKLCGDVDYDDCINITQNITPVPGGIGNITSTVIFKNLSLLK